jgi:hypothetical protein
MPELTVAEDIDYLRNKLFLQEGEKESIQDLSKEIRKSLSTTYRSIDNFIHNLKHG